MTSDTPPGQRLVKCSRCGWMHVALTRSEIAQFALSAEQEAAYRKCSGPMCGADPATFEPAGDDDTPSLARLPTIPGCIVSPH
jgi:hypothetical protein